MTPFQAAKKLKDQPEGFDYEGLRVESDDDGSPIVTDKGDLVFVTCGEPYEEVTEASKWMSEDGEVVEAPICK